MPQIAHSGRARIRIRRPRAMAESDRSGFWFSRDQMVRQLQWSGNQLIDTGLLVGPDEVDLPQQQFRAPILPPDPRPIVNPRPSPNVTGIPIIGQPLPTTPANQGFTQYTLGAPGTPGLYPITQAAVLAQVTTNSGVTPPPNISAFSVPLAGNYSTWLLGPDDLRTYLLIYNPTTAAVQFALASSLMSGQIVNLAIGPGEAYFWSTDQLLAPVWQGSVSALSPFGNSLPIWFWTDGTGFYNDSGILAFAGDDAATGWNTTGIGNPGDLWNNGRTVGVVFGSTPNPSAAPIFFGAITAPQLLALGGANIPTSMPTFGSKQIWNMSGMLAVA